MTAYAVESFDRCRDSDPCNHCKAGGPQAPIDANPADLSGGVWEFDDDVRLSLPPAFHRPEWIDTLTPPGWFCACCWDESSLQQWPCAVASRHGRYLSKSMRADNNEQAAEIQRLRGVAEAAQRVIEVSNLHHDEVDDLETVQHEAHAALIEAMSALPAVAGQPHYHDPIECGCELTAADAPKVQMPQAEAEKFNADHPVGTPVRYWKGVREGDGRSSRTRSAAEVLGGHTAVVWVDNEASCIALSHIQAAR